MWGRGAREASSPVTVYNVYIVDARFASEEQLFIEFPGSAVQAHEKAALIGVAGYSVLTLSPEDMIVDRLAAWQFWNSSTDGASAFLVWRAQAKRLDKRRLKSLADRRGVQAGLQRLLEFVDAQTGRNTSTEDLEIWASQKP